MTRPLFSELDFSSIQSENENGEVTTVTNIVAVGLGAVKRAVKNGRPQDFIERRIAAYNTTNMVGYYRDCLEVDANNETIQAQREAIETSNAELEEGQEPVALPEYLEFPVAPVALAYDNLSSMSEFKHLMGYRAARAKAYVEQGSEEKDFPNTSGNFIDSIFGQVKAISEALDVPLTDDFASLDAVRENIKTQFPKT